MEYTLKNRGVVSRMINYVIVLSISIANGVKVASFFLLTSVLIMSQEQGYDE